MNEDMSLDPAGQTDAGAGADASAGESADESLDQTLDRVMAEQAGTEPPADEHREPETLDQTLKRTFSEAETAAANAETASRDAKAIDEAFAPELAERMKAAGASRAAAVAEMINTMRAIRTDPGAAIGASPCSAPGASDRSAPPPP